MNEILKDKRFAHIPRDPAFKRIPRTEKKVKIDKRFQSMFSDKKFKVKYTVDKRGKPIRESSTDNLRRYYALESSNESEDSSGGDDDDDDDESAIKQKNKVKVTAKKSKKVPEKQQADSRLSLSKSAEVKELKRRNARNSESHDYSISSFQRHAERTLNEFEGSGGDSKDSSQDEDNDDLDREHNLDAKIRGKLEDLSVDYARGEGRLLSDSSSDEETTEEEDEDEVDHGWGELDQDAERTDESTRRLAVCNMDWDRIRAQDLMVLLTSFLPKGGIIHSVTVYPSEFGLQRLKEEEEKGPLELRGEGDEVVVESDFEDDEKKKKKKARDEDEVEEGSHYQREKLRQYQLNRLRYYYAVVVCDSVATADALYKECDGMEYESSASHLDLRFIPDGTTFDQEPRETCSDLPEMKKYEPQLFITTALQQSKVRLTWDETDPQRLKFNEKIISGKVDDVDENDLKVYLATSSSEENSSDAEDQKEASASKYQALLQTLQSKEEEKRQKSMEMEVTWGIDLKQKVEKRLKDGKPDELTPFQKYMQKRKEKKKAKREEQLKKKQQFKETGEENGDHVSDSDDVPSDIDMDDAYFKEEFETEEFAHTKKTESKNKKNKKKKEGELEDEETKRKKAELELLLMDGDDNKKHFSLRDILVDDKKNKKKKKAAKEEINEKNVDDFEVNVQDNRFSAIFTSHLYNIDPADPHYKKTKGMEALRQEKLNRRVGEEIPTKKPKVETLVDKKDPELSLLVKNVKRKAQTLGK